MKNKNIKLIILIVVLVGIGFFAYKKAVAPKNDVAVIPTDNKVSLCYYDSVGTFPYVDKFWLRLNLDQKNKEIVSGEFNSIPAQKDSKVGTFSGTVGPLDQKIMARTADVWWDSLAEGMNVKEELIINFGDGSASTMGGEMVDRGDGVYVYKDKTKLSPSTTLGQVDCFNYEEMKIVEKYVRDNIKTIATDKAVLGGSWYLLGANVIPATKSGSAVYEDGHIQSKATFTYTIDNQIVKITSWKVGK